MEGELSDLGFDRAAVWMFFFSFGFCSLRFRSDADLFLADENRRADRHLHLHLQRCHR